MKLTELNPKWFAEEGRHGQGVTFDCPHCRSVRLAAAFAPTLDGGAPIGLKPGEMWPALAPSAQGNPKGTVTVPPSIHWQRTGDTFETLTLSPSVDASPAGHWHGFVIAGEIR